MAAQVEGEDREPGFHIGAGELAVRRVPGMVPQAVDQHDGPVRGLIVRRGNQPGGENGATIGTHQALF